MARSRSFKPELLIDERLVACSMAARWLYVGMGTEADREGRLEDRPLRLKLAVLPGDNVEVEHLLVELQHQALILRYEAEGKRFIQILDWDKLQSPHIKEPASTIPAPPQHEASTEPAPTKPVQAPGEHVTSTLPAALTSDSGLLTLTSDPQIAEQPAAASAGKRKAVVDEGKTVATWKAYATGFQERYRTAPIRSAKVSGQLARFVDAVGSNDAPQIAAFYVSKEDRFYVEACHPVDFLLRDAQKLRTQWATGLGASRHSGFADRRYDDHVGPNGEILA